MCSRTWVKVLLCVAAAVSLSATKAMGANILFIDANDATMQPSDDLLKAFLESLGHTVTYLDDDTAEINMENAAATVDLVFISESVGSAKVQNKITGIETPIVTCEAWGYEEMGLTAVGTGEGLAVESNDIEIVKPGDPLAAGLSGTVTVLTAITGGRGDARFTKGVAGQNATVVARATLSDGVTYDVIWVYEKGAILPTPPADGSPQRAGGIRVCFGFDEQSVQLWNDNAYALFTAAINFGLGIRLQPQAYSPAPANDEGEAPRDAVLSWRKGIYADTHDVYFGTDFNDVNQATADDPRGVLVSTGKSDLTYDPGALFDYGQTYYWRVDEVNAPDNPGLYRGDVWKFTVLNFIAIDNFEGYTDNQPNRVFDTWSDGWEVEQNGCTVGYPEPDWSKNEHYIETLLAHTGKQCMPYFYDNDKKYSQATMQMPDALKDWTQAGVESLSFWYRGYAAYVGGFKSLPGGVYEVTGAGADIWAGADEFHFAYKEVPSGNVTIVVKVESFDPLNKDTKAGVMVRDSLDPGSTNAALLLTPDPNKGLRCQTRTSANGATARADADMDPNAMAPYWLKLTRTSGGLVRAYRSPDGVNWTQFGLKTVSMTMPVYIGLAVTSHVANTPATATFSNVSFPDTTNATVATQPWTDVDVGIMTNDPEPMYVVVNDTAVVHSDSQAATIGDTWTQWVIPLSDLAAKGIDLTNVTSLGIGVGTRGNTTEAGGSGKLFIDDVRLDRPEQ
jgi:hypothetical protein